MSYVIISEKAKSACELITAAKKAGASAVNAILFDAEASDIVAKSGVQGVTVIELAEDAPVEASVDAIVGVVSTKPSATVLFAASRRMVALAASVSKNLDTSPIVDVEAFDGEGAVNALYGGKALVKQAASGPYAVYVCRAGIAEAAPAQDAAAPIQTIPVEAARGIKVRERRAKGASGADLGAAKVVVCVGRGVSTREGFEQCVALKDALGGEMACSRPVTETADPFMPRDTYLGASGLSIKPELYVGIAVSGQQQHTMGMYQSGKVVVINSDKNALFFKACDYGLVGKYEEVVPAIVKALGA